MGDCYFLAAIAACAEFSERIMKIFLNTEINEVGMYGMKLFVDGEMLFYFVNYKWVLVSQL